MRLERRKLLGLGHAGVVADRRDRDQVAQVAAAAAAKTAAAGVEKDLRFAAGFTHTDGHTYRLDRDTQNDVAGIATGIIAGHGLHPDGRTTLEKADAGGVPRDLDETGWIALASACEAGSSILSTPTARPWSRSRRSATTPAPPSTSNAA